jgi:arginine decarboxylase
MTEPADPVPVPDATADLSSSPDASPEEHDWTVADALDLYNVEGWSNGYFSVNERGSVTVCAGAAGLSGNGVDLKKLVDQVRTRGLTPPLLLRFWDVLKARIDELNGAFAGAIEEFGYRGVYRGVYPIKVNQDRFLAEQLVAAGKRWHYGLEAGSKPELLAAAALLDDPEALLVCNGYKDETYVETALLASKLDRKIVLVAEKPSELETIIEVAERTGVRPRIGIRAKLSARGTGHWQESGGDRSKFGLSAGDMVDAVRSLRRAGYLDCLKLLHFHLGSQISSIRAVKDAVLEAAWLYVQLRELGAPMGYLDVGGGLGVDYDGSRSDFSSSLNYTLQEYANDIVYGVQEVCDQQGVEHPTLVSESGRAVVAHHAVLVIDVLEASEPAGRPVPSSLPDDADPVLERLFETSREMTAERALEAYHDATSYRDQCRSLFNLGRLSLNQRALAEDLHASVAWRALEHLARLEEPPEELETLERGLAATYFCNFSLFQSLPDSWAIDQLFPVIPLHRLDERPTRQAVLADITCDSDGKMDRFIDRKDVRRFLDLHPYGNGSSREPEPYYLGVFLVGAYQEILGDLHNLFGDTHAVHVSCDADGRYRIDGVVEGDTVTDVLRYVRYSRKGLIARVRQHVEKALDSGAMQLNESRQLLQMFERGLNGYTYLHEEDEG